MKKVKKKIIISGGGTGGHIYPGIALAEALKATQPENEVLFVGASGKMEMEKVPKAGYEIVGLPIRGLQRRLTLANLKLPFLVLRSFWKAHRLIKKHKPDALIGTGGYASLAMLYVANLHKLPTFLVEPNSYPGLANRVLAKKAKAIFVAYKGMEKHFSAQKIQQTGTPLRAGVAKTFPEKAAACRALGFSTERPVLLVLGGSGGARSINEAMTAALPELEKEQFQVLWQTGKFYIDGIREKFPEEKEGRKIVDFCYQMPEAYAAADLIVARAGALTLAELAFAEKPVLLIPSPNVAEDHQTKNAEALVQAGAAELLADADAKTDLLERMLALWEDQEKRDAMAKAWKAFAHPEAAKEAVEIIYQKIS